jgi:hypothetical protein
MEKLMVRAIRSPGGQGPAGSVARPRTRRPLALGAAVVLAVVVSACGIHISKNGISGNILGHKFSAAEHALPAGFPSDVPVPAKARVLGGGGATNNGVTGYDVAFAVSGSVASVLTGYQNQFKAAGYTVSDVQNPQSVTTPTSGGAGSGTTSTTVTLTGGSFVATNDSWKVEVLGGTSSSAVSSELKAGEVGVNIIVTSKSTTTTT